MKRLKLGVVMAACVLLVTQSVGEARRGGYVRGYTRRDGTYVSGHYRGGSSSYSSGSSYSSSSSYSTKTFSSCAAARAAGYSNMTTGSAGYSSGLDRDSDGIACESGSGSSSSGLGLVGGAAVGGVAAASATRRPAAALPGAAYFLAKDLQSVGGSISKLSSNTYQLAAFKHTINLIPTSVLVINDGKKVKVAAAPVIYRNSLYVPAQYLFKLGCNVDMADSYMVMASCPNYRTFTSANVMVW